MGRPGRSPNYDYSSAGCYFVTFCTRNREKILSDIVGQGTLTLPKIYLTETETLLDGYISNIPNIYRNVSVDNYVIMPNHVHILLSVREEPGGARAPRPTVMGMIGSIKSLTSRAVGKPIWQTSFHDRIIRSETEYLEIWNYIDTNPARWADDCYYKEA